MGQLRGKKSITKRDFLCEWRSAFYVTFCVATECQQKYHTVGSDKENQGHKEKPERDTKTWELNRTVQNESLHIFGQKTVHTSWKSYGLDRKQSISYESFSLYVTVKMFLEQITVILMI